MTYSSADLPMADARFGHRTVELNGTPRRIGIDDATAGGNDGQTTPQTGEISTRLIVSPGFMWERFLRVIERGFSTSGGDR